MKFSATRKINLGNIDPMLQYESEELGVSDCDSPEEAAQKLDLWVKDRILHYKEVVMKLRSQQTVPPISTPPPTGGPHPAPMKYPAPSATIPGPQPTTTAPAPGGVSSAPPAEFG